LKNLGVIGESINDLNNLRSRCRICAAASASRARTLARGFPAAPYVRPAGVATGDGASRADAVIKFPSRASIDAKVSREQVLRFSKPTSASLDEARVEIRAGE